MPRPAATRPLAAAHAGTCYPPGHDEALAYFRDFFGGESAPPWPLADGDTPRLDGLAGIVAPHIDFRVSRDAYAHAFAPWFHAPPADTYLILGVGHRSRLEWNLGRRDILTPLGRAAVDRDAVERLGTAFPALLREPGAHEGEHSIEFPLVLLQAYHELRGVPPFRYVPLLCGSLVDYLYEDAPPHEDDLPHRLAAAVGDWLETEAAAGRRVQIIVSVDGCHIGPRFQHPVRVNPLLLADTELWEMALWAHAEAGAFDSFVAWLRHEGNMRHFDGVGALGLLMLMQRPPRIRRTYYEQWFEPRDHSVVTFSSGTLEAPPL